MFGNRLKKLREEKGLTQQELADIMHVGRPTIAGYETKRKEPDFEKLSWLASYFEVTIDYLLGKSNNKTEPATVDVDGYELHSAQNSTEKKVLLIARKASDIPESDREELINMFEKTIDLYLKSRGKDA
jgi:transcriptional regulator with XRE-family HTH domain